MNATTGLKKVLNLTSGIAKGSRREEVVLTRTPKSSLKGISAVAVLVALLVAASIQPRRRGEATMLGRKAGAARGKGSGNRRRPRSAAQYYGMGLLIGALERDATRKMAIAMLKLVRKRT